MKRPLRRDLNSSSSFQGKRDTYVETGNASQEVGDHARSERISPFVQAAIRTAARLYSVRTTRGWDTPPLDARPGQLTWSITHIGLTRGVHCSAEQIILTTGGQGALDLAARVLLDPGDAAWVEDPGYSGARGALLAAGAQPVTVPVDGQGLAVEAGRQLGPAARLAIVT